MCEGKSDIRWPSLFFRMFAICLAGWLGLAGCSSFHEVTVVGHGIQEPEPPLSAELNDDAPTVPETIYTPEPSPAPPLPPQASKPISAQTATETVKADSLVQSLEEGSLSSTLEDVYFDFDQYRIRPEAIDILERNAKVLKNRFPDRELILQGHCDERGTEEYNLILGERRASAVKKFLNDLGVSPDNLRVVSLGKMQPFCSIPSLECFQKNRRVHFVLK